MVAHSAQAGRTIAACHLVDRFVRLVNSGLTKHHSVTESKLWCSKQALKLLITLAWNDNIRLLPYFVGYETKVMVNRNSCGEVGS